MKIITIIPFGISALFFASGPSLAQCTADAPACTQTVPHLLKLNGTLKEVAVGTRAGALSVRFSIYGDSASATPLWQEVQNTQVDQQGHYEVMLGTTASQGIPADLFSTGEPRWLGVQAILPGSEEQPRVLLVSVPYALEAANAQTLGGLPASAFARAIVSETVQTPTVDQNIAVSSAAPRTTSTGLLTELPSLTAANPSPAAVGTVNNLPKYSSSTTFVDSQITDLHGVVSVQNLANVLFADRFTDGVPGAVAACPAHGCVISAVSPHTNLNLGNIDPGTKAITIYLGPFTYTVKQITLRKALKIIGMGASGGTNGSPTCSVALPCNGTQLQSINGNNPVFVLPQTNNQPATDVALSGFRILGSGGNTAENAFFLDSSATVNSGLWYSTLDDIGIMGFAGDAIYVKGRGNDFLSATQWVFFNNIIVFRTAGGRNALRVEGSAFELRFTNCEFDGQGIGDGTNIYIGGSGAGVSGYPTSLVFEGLVSQSAATAVQIDGAVNLAFHGSHHEQLLGAYQITNKTNIGTQGLIISDSYFAGNVGVNGGSGYELNVGTTSADGVVFAHNQIFGNPDSVVSGTNFSSVVYQDNFYLGGFNGPVTSGITTQMTPAATINIRGVHSVGLNPAATPITTIQSSLGPGEMVTFFALSGGAVVFAGGGNIDLLGANPVVVTGTMTFVRSDLGGVHWKPVSAWTPPAPPPPVVSAPAHAQKTIGRAQKLINAQN
jgi:hypothetical protein